jgi:Ca-activated chloride channel family protein
MTNFLAQFSQFHFLRPDWFWVLIPLAIFWLLKLKMVTTTQWHQVIPPHLANAMLGNNKQNKVKQKKWYVPYIWLLTVIALAGPTWEKVEKPVFQVKRASVLVLDMSMSMRATDIKPNRLSKARYKAIDLANAITDGEVALVAYAGDAFTISPLTPDTRNITAMIPSLKPEIMPVQGSYPLMGLTKATELLQQAGYPNGDIYWITDGIENEDIPDLTSFAGETPYRINIMTVGTAEGAPIKMLDNSLLKDHLGSIVIPKLNNRDLMNLSNVSNGVFVNTTATDADIRTLLAANVTRAQDKQNQDDAGSTDKNSLTGDDWQEFGPYIILLILPFVLVFFRKGAGILMLFFLPFTFTPNNAIAADNTKPDTTEGSEKTNVSEKSWTDYAFKTQNQVGADQFNSGQYEQALGSFEDTQWKGASAYKSGDYESAFNYFSQDSSAQGLYNQGNALANLNKLDEAIKAYEESLKLDPNNESVKANKALLEQLKQQQDQQKQDSEQQQNQDGEQDKDQQSGQDQDSDQESDKNSDQKSEDSSEQQSDQQNDSSQDSSNSDSQSDQTPEPTPSENKETPEQQSSSDKSQSEQESEQEDNKSEAQTEGKEQGEKTEQEAKAAQAQLSQDEIENKEQEQKLQQLLRKVSDDPATLLRNKMILESKKRQQSSRTPKGVTKSW